MGKAVGALEVAAKTAGSKSNDSAIKMIARA